MPQPLAEILIEDQLASSEGVARAAEVADKKKEPLVAAVVRELGVDEVALVAAVRRRLRIPMTDPADADVDPEALRELSRDLCRRQRVMPLSVALYDSGPKILRLAMADPTDTVAVAEVEHATGCRVEPTLITLSAVEELIETSYRHFVTEVMARPGPASRASRPTAKAAPGPPEPTTVPFKRVSEDADLALRLEALLSLLIEKGVLAEEDYEERLRVLLKRDDG